MQKVFLSSKKVFLNIEGEPEHENFLLEQIYNSLRKPTKIVGDNMYRVTRSGEEVKLTKKGKVNLPEGRRGYILEFCSCRECEICGIFFYEEGDSYMTEMVDPNSADVIKIITEDN